MSTAGNIHEPVIATPGKDFVGFITDDPLDNCSKAVGCRAKKLMPGINDLVAGILPLSLIGGSSLYG